MKTGLMKRTILLAGTSMACLPAWALAEPPASFDRVPAEAVAALGIKNVESFDKKIGSLLDAAKVLDQSGLEEVRALMKIPGINPKGSVSLVFFEDHKPKPAKDAAADDMGDELDGDEPPMVAVIPVSDFAAFAKHFGAEGAKGVVELKAPEGEVEMFGGAGGFAKDIGGGYAAMSDRKELVEKFEGKGGNLPAHVKMLGKVGSRISDASDAVMMVNVPKIAPMAQEKLKEGMAEAEQNVGAMGPQGAQAKAALDFFQTLTDGFFRDAQVGVVGLGLDEGGVWMDFGAQYKEGTESFKSFQGKGNANAVLGKLPDQPFFLATAFDTSDPATKKLLKQMADAAKKAAPAGEEQAANAMTLWMDQVDSINGMSMILGQSAGGMTAGLFSSASMYVASSDPAAYAAAMKDYSAKTNGLKVNGMTMKSTYEPAALDIGGVKVDKWSSTMEIDPNDENAMMAQQSMMMLYGGSTGPSGYAAVVDKGYVMTMSPSKTLMTAAMDSAKGTKSLGANKDLMSVAGKLPADRSIEGFIGVKALLDTAAMFTGKQPGPEALPPVGIGGTNTDGGNHFRLYVPMQVITKLNEMFGDSGEEPMEGDAPAEDENQPPRF